MIWNSPWGNGFPGWHVECSAMSLHYLNGFVDLHLGGIDLRFPHHENERAQSNCIIDQEAVALWLHGEHLLFEGRKMAKSSNNVVLVSDLIARNLDPLALRLCFLENRYRSQMDLSWDSLKAAHQLLQRWREKILIWQASDSMQSDEGEILISQIVADLCDDLDTPRALQKIRSIEKSQSIGDGVKLEVFNKIDKLFGLDLFNPPNQSKNLPDHLNEILIQRQKARSEGNFSESDRLRDLLSENGIAVNDSKDGQTWNWLVSD
jgi:cysteinyl-tRNA synthetase